MLAQLAVVDKSQLMFEFLDIAFLVVDFVVLVVAISFATPIDGREAVSTSALVTGLLASSLFALKEAIDYFRRLLSQDSMKRTAMCTAPFYLLSILVMLGLSVSMTHVCLESGIFLSEEIQSVSLVIIMVCYVPGLALRYNSFSILLFGDERVVSPYISLRACVRNKFSTVVAKNAYYAAPATGELFQAPVSGRVHIGDYVHQPGVKRSRVFYLSLWLKVIEPEIKGLCKEEGICCPDLDRAFSDIFDAYQEFNEYASSAYLDDESAQLDRHKIAACYTYAILAVRPLVVNDRSRVSPSVYYANERLAVTLGCSVLVTFIVGYYNDRLSQQGIEASERDLLRTERDVLIENGIKLPVDAPHDGSYLETIYRCLRFTEYEGSYNLLLLSSLFWIFERESVSPSLYKEMFAWYGNPEGR